MKIGRRLIHYSIKPLRSVHSVAQGSRGTGFLKPCGLWVSAEGEDDWAAWCEGEQWGLGSLKNPVEVILSADANLLHLTTADEIDAFEVEYVTEANYPHETGNPYRRESVAWDRVASKYQGIVISPYVWERRLSNTMWYYGWDCASGCIWDATAVKALRSVEAASNAA